MNDLTVVYYTSNREDEAFEGRIRANLLEQIEGLPLVSVSQKPIDFGENICVWDIGATPDGMLMQTITGAKAAKTQFIGFAEADVLYHRSYYDFRPERDDAFYYPDEVYILWQNRRRYYLKKRREITSIVNREYFIKIAQRVLTAYTPDQHVVNMVRKVARQKTFYNEIPVIDIKTRNGMHWGTLTSKDYTTVVPYWGEAGALLNKYL